MGGFYLQFRKLKKQTKIPSQNLKSLNGWYILSDFYQQKISKSGILPSFLSSFSKSKRKFQEIEKKPKNKG